MAVLYQSIKQLRNYLITVTPKRSISLSATSYLKEIIEKKEGNTLTIEGVIVPQKNADRQMKIKSNACPLCALGLEVKHTDVLILSQFLRSDGCMLPRRITGLCNMQQKRIGIMVAMAQKAGLMPNLAPAWSKKDPKLRRDWKKFNTYYDEDTIVYKLPRNYN